MLNDLYSLESFYGAQAAALFFSDLARRYGTDFVTGALQSGDLTVRQVYVGPDSGRRLIYLTDQGRGKVMHDL